MLSIAIFLIPTAYVCWRLIRKRKREWRTRKPWIDKADIVFYTCITAMVAGMIAFFGAWGLSEWMGDDEEVVSGEGTGRIVRLNDSVGAGGEISGSFFLGIGGVNGRFGPELTYSWYERTAAGLRGSIVSEDEWNDVFVRERKGVPHYVWIDREDPCETPGWLAPFELCDTKQFQTEWVIVVPEGTVLHGYSLDAG